MILTAFISFVVAEIIGKLLGLLYSNNQSFAELNDVNKLIQKNIDNSFPSDHTILLFSFCFIFFLFHKKLRKIWLVIACIVGLSRIWVGVHYPFDVLVGEIVAIITSILAYIFVFRLEVVENVIKMSNHVENMILAKIKKEKRQR